MSFRLRVFLACLAVVVIPVSVVGVGLRAEIEESLREGYEERVGALATVIEEDLARESAALGERLDALADAVASDNRFRTALLGGAGERTYLLDYATRAMELAGLSVLQIQGPDGRIVSSGHFRNAYDVRAPQLPRSLSALPEGAALARVRTAEGELVALVRVDSVRLGGLRYHLVGGTRVDEGFLSALTRDPDLSVRLVLPGGTMGAAPTGSVPEPARAVAVPWVGGGSGGSEPTAAGGAEAGRFEISYDDSILRALRRSADAWFVLLLSGAVALALVTATWLSARVSRPLEALAAKAGRLDLSRLDVDFGTGRRDEIGQLSRVLDRMTERLRAGARELRDAERRATLGEMARQVNHDVRNGLVPIRNVLRHLDEVATGSPAELAEVFRQRRGSLAASVGYLETLAGNYERLSSRAGSGSADPGRVVSAVVEGAAAGSPIRIRADLDPGTPWVRGDPVSLRRIVENLVANATDAVSGEGERGEVTVATSSRGDTVHIAVRDTGPGMGVEERRRAFEDFYTTKEEGTGLGLPVVRRLIRDLGGSVELVSEEGRGTTVTVALPAAGGEEAS